MKVDFSILVCFNILVTFANCNQDCGWEEYSCGTQCQSLETPCEGMCSNDMLLIDNICEESWDCNGTIQRVSETCNTECPLHRCLSYDGISCESNPGFHSCGDKCKPLSTPCEGLCSKDMLLIDNMCEESWDCNGKQQLLSTPCEGLCSQDYLLIGIDNICENAWNTWECNGKRQLISTPCEDLCSEYYVFIAMDNICEISENTWECNGKQQLLSTPCEGLCGKYYVLIAKDNLCEASGNTWECNGTIQRLNETCNRECEKAPYDYYSCGDKCQPLTTPCEGLCSNDMVLIDNSCEGLWNTWECNGRQQLKATPCNGLCESDYDVLIANNCVWIQNTFDCNGIIKQFEDTCNRQCPLGGCLSSDGPISPSLSSDGLFSPFLSSDGLLTPLPVFGGLPKPISAQQSCERVSGQEQYSCGDECQLLSLPCKGLCVENYELLVLENICEERWKTWDCNGTIQRVNETCNRECHRNRCLIANGLSCEEAPIGHYSCGGKCQSWTIPCNRQCPEYRCLSEDGQNCEWAPPGYYSCGGKCQSDSTPCKGMCSNYMVLIDNICEYSYETWECNGTFQSLNKPCNGQCRLDRCLNEDGLSCEEAPYDRYSCDGKCQSWTMPCNKKCLKPLQLFDGACFWGNELQLGYNDISEFLFKPVEKVIWECDGKQQLITTPCNEECPGNLTLVAGSCLTEYEFWVCDNVNQPINKPCYGLCSYISTKNELEGTYQTDYVKCENECLLREHAWDCNGRCISKKKSCDGSINKDFKTWPFPCYVELSISLDGEGILLIECRHFCGGCLGIFETSAVASQSLVQTVIQNHSEPGDLLYLSSSIQDHPFTNSTMGVYLKSKVIHNRFPVYYHTKRAYYIFVDKEGFWAVSNRIGYTPSTLYRNNIHPTPEQPPRSGWMNVIGGVWKEDTGVKLVVLAVVSRKTGVCPAPEYCRRGERCCKLVWAGPNRGYICPTNC